MIKIGTSGFSFPDWVGKVYPLNTGKGEKLYILSRTRNTFRTDTLLKQQGSGCKSNVRE